MIFRASILSAALSILIFAQITFALTEQEIAKVNEYLQEGGALIKQNKSKEAVEKFRAAKELAPTSALVMCNLGFALERCGKYDEALANLKESIRIDPKIPIAWVNLAGLYQSTGRIPEAIETFDEYLRRFPTDTNAKDARSIVAILRDTKAVNNANKVSADTPDYYSSVVRAGVQKWDSSRFPLKVFISKGNQAQGYQNSFAAQIRNGFTEWQSKANNAVSFVFVDSPADADIVVNWTNDESKVAKKGEAGDCRTRLGAKGIEHAAITMLMIPLSDSIPLGDSLIHWVGMHEIGHALGIAGHSVNSNDIMYATMTYDYDQKGVSSRDVATLLHLYQPGLKATGSSNESH
jgi:predicted Zn-dependent protease